MFLGSFVTLRQSCQYSKVKYFEMLNKRLLKLKVLLLSEFATISDRNLTDIL